MPRTLKRLESVSIRFPSEIINSGIMEDIEDLIGLRAKYLEGNPRPDESILYDEGKLRRWFEENRQQENYKSNKNPCGQ